MQQKGSISTPLRGMQRDNISSQVKPDGYILGVNINSSNENEGYTIQNEPSNYLSTILPVNYKVIGYRNSELNNRTYFFLTSIDPNINSIHHKRSIIGYIDNSFSEVFNQEIECGDCRNPKNLLNTPLEQITQVPNQPFIELVNDRCISLSEIEEKGLNFDINFPIKKIELKQEKLGTTLYWNDNRNYFRYLQVGRIEEALEKGTFDYLHTIDEPCDDPIEASCLDVDKLLVNPKHIRIVLEADKEQTGGNLKQGTYEFFPAYCDGYGNEITEYATPTNPISIWDENNYIQNQTETDDYTNFAIKIKVNNLDTKRFKYYKIAVVERNNVNETASVFVAGIYPTTDNVISYTHSASLSPNITRGNVSTKARMDIADLYAIKPQYKRMKGTMVSDDKLFGFGLEEEEEINLQPVVNLFSGLVKAQTSVANENLYKSAIATSKYKQYVRDEVQPLAIRFLYNDGGYSSNFPFVGRPKDSEESKSFIQTSGSLKVGDKYIISNLNLGDSFANVGYVSENTPFTATGTTPSSWANSTTVTNITDENLASLLAGQSSCSENTRLEKWQIYNTAKELDTESCFDLNANSIQLPPEEIEKICYVEVSTIIPANTIILTNVEDFEGLEDYVNNNPSVDIPEITPYLLASYPETCTPTYIGNCDAPILSSAINQIEEVLGETNITQYKTASEYLKSVAPDICSPYKRSEVATEAGESPYQEDTEIDQTLLPCSNGVRKKVYLRDSTFKNEVCAYSTSLPFQTDPSTSTSPVYFNYDASATLNDLLVDNSNFSVSDYTLGITPVTMVVPNAFYNKLHNKAQFFNVKKEGREQIVFEVTKKSKCDSQNDAFASIDNTEVRYVIYDDCTSPNQIGGGLVNLNTPLLTVIDVTAFPENFIIAVDTKITTQSVPLTCGGTDRPVYYVTPPCGCFGVYQRDPEAKSITVSWQSIKIRKKLEYVANCTSSIPRVNDCDPIPFKKYKMAYWESTVEYPDNKQLYDSSTLKIAQEDLNILSPADKADFIEYYTNGFNTNGTYKLKDATNLRCKPIRHPKFPDNTVAPFMIDNLSHKEGAESIIFPMGVNFDAKIVRAMLQVAYVNNLITKKQKEKIVGWEILKGDNSIHKSKTASGILYDVYKYTKKGDEIHFSNFPFNDLGNNKFVKDPVTKKLINHPYNGEKNNKFTFISPDMLLTRPAIPTEMSLQGYMFGSAQIDFADVKKHPKWTVLGDNARRTATQLAILEATLELAVKVAQSVEAYRITVGLSNSFNPGLFLALASGAAALAATPANIGRYRYDWLQIFRNLGAMDNFASFQYGVGKHNKFLKIENEDSNSIRRLSIKKHMRDGNFDFTDENNGKVTRFNNDLREHSVFLSTGDYYIEYPDDYKNFDNNILNTKKSSNFLSSEVTELNPRRNIANPYVYLKNYVPDQWETIDDIQWLTTNYIFNTQEDTECRVIYGGSEVISRLTYRIKVPLFLDNAINTPDKLAYRYSQNSNIGDAAYYCNYETPEDSTYKKLGFVFPDIDSDYNFDQTTGKDRFYLKPPSKFYLFTHGIVDFLVESEINCNFRYGKPEPKDQFYKNQNLSEYLQEVNLPMSLPNTFYYNNNYSSRVTKTIYKKLTRDYDKEIWQKRALKPNAYIWSEKDSDENSLIDPYLIFKLNNVKEEGTENGKLIDLRSIESAQFLGRYENTYQLFNPANPVADAINRQNGTGFLDSRPTTLKKSDLGFAGTQNTEFVSTPYGRFWADAKRGRIFQIDQNGGNMEIISEAVQGQPSGMKQWFREHLPFKILKQFPKIDIDNKFKGLGLNMWYDDRMSRVFLTKRDYIATNTECLKYEEGLGFYTDCEQTQLSCPIGYTYNEATEMCEKTTDSDNLCPAGYTYNATLKTCTLVETIDAQCTCTADVLPITKSICSGNSTSINLATTSPDAVTYTWTVLPNGVTGASAGSGTSINQVLTNPTTTDKTAFYIATPIEVASGCVGTPVSMSVTVKPTITVVATPSSLTINDGDTAVINLTSNLSGTTYNWTVVQSGVTGATSGTGSTISQVLAGEGTATYTITPTNNGCTGTAVNVVVTVESTVLACLADFEITVETITATCSGHSCNGGTFNVLANDINIGVAYLSNTGGSEDVCGSNSIYPNVPCNGTGSNRTSVFTITTQQAQSISANAVNGNITFSLDCALNPNSIGYQGIAGNCHTSAAHMVMKRNGVVMYDECPNGNTFTINPCTGVVTP